MPREGITRADYIAKKFGARGYSSHDRLVHAGAQLGIAFAFDKIARQPNTLATHALIEAARRKGVQGAVKEAMLKAFFVDSQDLTDEKTLVRDRRRGGIGCQGRRSGRSPTSRCAAPSRRKRRRRAPWV